MAKNSLERYTHYYERWASNQTVCTIFLYLSLKTLETLKCCIRSTFVSKIENHEIF